ncbi:hypothetical protein BN903_272 [Halorubrum sp. AJ67]|nr:hypothetical protein BN903_272 [Halorubrum sp. AJ67]
MSTITDKELCVCRDTEERMRSTCPQCGGSVTREHGSLGCLACGYTPNHGAD